MVVVPVDLPLTATSLFPNTAGQQYLLGTSVSLFHRDDGCEVSLG